jgi:hypothetical protein
MISLLVFFVANFGNLINVLCLNEVRSNMGGHTNYEYSLDYLIVDILFDGPKYYRELKRHMECYSRAGKKISFDTYNRHLLLLQRSKLLVKKRIRNKVLISLEETYKKLLTNGQPIDENRHFPEKKGTLVSSIRKSLLKEN